ncbi:spore germination protein [Paenibacillus sp. 1001270B_150601_E10]|uniref:spore germination protein n=1 Tax=Paenibacillus sp. 1001270B_150601_E10 TaxID=2787079 RepID=UPI00189ED1FA|nr:spore germination protein [Paenibacillus sp. 1001270B_150601_E10]
MTDHSTNSNQDQTPPSLDYTLEQIVQIFGSSSDLIVRRLTLGRDHKIGVGVIYFNGLVDDKKIYRLILSLQTGGKEVAETNVRAFDGTTVPSWVYEIGIQSGDVKVESSLDRMLSSILNGSSILFLEGEASGCLVINTSGGEHRAVSEPTSQTTIRGPKEGFTETLQINIALIRKRIRNVNLWAESMVLGSETHTNITLMYLKSKVKVELLQEVRIRLQNMKLEAILESNYIEESIQDSTFGIFPTVNNTERPDVAASAILEGRVVILVDGTPFALMVPALLTQFFQSPDDYYHRYDFGLTRLLRYLSYMITLLTPGLFIALTTYHQEMLPTTLLISIAAQREGIPFPAFIEALIMELTFLLLYEAGIRLPRAVGSAISIVGALVLGQAAVEANLISAAMVIIVSITAITSQIFPNPEVGISLRILRFGMMGLAASFGLIGMFFGIILIILHLSHLESFGYPFTSPFAPVSWNAQRDNVLRMPWRMRDWRRPSQEEPASASRNDS